MIQTEAGLKSTQEALALLEGMMFRLYQEKEKYHPRQYYAMMADPLVDEIRKLRAQIDEGIGLTDFDQATKAYEANGTPSLPTPASSPSTSLSNQP
jgi:hypothetical protein